MPGFKALNRRRGDLYRAKLTREREQRMDQFAELLANGWTVVAASKGVGVSIASGTKMLADIRQRLGDQAR